MSYSPLINIIFIFLATYLIWIEIFYAMFVLIKEQGSGRKKLFLSLVIIGAASYLIDIIAGLLYQNPRPFVVGNFTPLASHSPDNGFPSDHTIFAGAIAGAFILYKKQIGFVLILVALLVGLGRVLAGVHHVVDVIGSICIVTFVTALYRYLTNKTSGAVKTASRD